LACAGEGIQLKFKASASKVVFSGTLASDKSDKHGDFKLEVADPPVEGKFYGKIKQKTIGSGAGKIICLERQAASLTITVN
jgi:hypothetical protein